MYENYGYEQHGQGYQIGQDSQIVNQPGLFGPPYTDQEVWFSQYDQGQVGPTSVVPIHMRSNPTEGGYSDPTPGYKAPLQWWDTQSTGMKVAIVGSAALVLGGVGYWLLKKK